MQMTLRELLKFSQGASHDRWDHTASILAMLHNCHRPESLAAATASDYHPHERAKQAQQPKIKGDIQALKVFLTKRE